MSSSSSSGAVGTTTTNSTTNETASTSLISSTADSDETQACGESSYDDIEPLVSDEMAVDPFQVRQLHVGELGHRHHGAQECILTQFPSSLYARFQTVSNLVSF